ncbi:MAG: LysM peptidoglycan-binding domain-containing protein [Victivallales bacterium]|nr:LysM peptidoglycan-binding domain-containing protein [Victivallales bacterium]
MNKVWLAALGFALLGYGCGPQLAQSPYGQKETRWEGYVKKSYPSWTPAKTIPPVEQQSEVVPAAPVPENPPVKAAPAMTAVPAEAPSIQTFDEKMSEPEPELSTPIAAAPVKEEPESYTVGKGDTLGGIARKFYGKASKWRVILDANKDKVTNPNKLRVGTVLVIPVL